MATQVLRSLIILVFILMEAGLLYCQQDIGDIRYDIRTRLDDVKHTLKGDISISGTNRSNDTLFELHILLYPNAYSSRNTAYAQQHLLHGMADFHFANEHQQGSISGLDFSMAGNIIPAVSHPDTTDIATLKLLAPILPGEHFELKTPFIVKLPKMYSRLGHIDQSYFITQWYPKLAMYSEGEWYDYPYLDLGEFFSPFADYTVEIELPENYTVAATGELKTRSEQLRLDSLARVETTPPKAYPASSKTTKVLSYSAEDVIDFAWFADKRFAVRKDTAIVGDWAIDCYVFFTEESPDAWHQAAEFVVESVEFFSENIGHYPYPQATVVAGPDDIGGGMEYPMITLIGGIYTSEWIDRIIAHEIGHNWFYGILATNERKYAWMDEGLTTFYEDKYMQQKYDHYEDYWLPVIMRSKHSLSDQQLLLADMYAKGRLGSPTDDPAFQSDLSYLLNAYSKSSLSFHMLEEMMGAQAFETAIRQYFDNWKFKHPEPNDLRAILEGVCQCELGWMFDGLLGSEKLPDYKLSSVDFENNRIEIANQGTIATPVEIVAKTVDRDKGSIWVQSGSKDQFGTIMPYDSVSRIDLYNRKYSLDATPGDNSVNMRNGKQKRISLGFGLPGKTREPDKYQISALPAIGWNTTDGAMLGAYLSNLVWPVSSLQWTVIPMYAIKSKSITGIGSVKYRHFTNKGRLDSWQVGADIKSFNYYTDDHYGFSDRYMRVSPGVLFNFNNGSNTSDLDHTVGVRFIYVSQNYGQGIDFDNKIWEEKSRSYYVNELTYALNGSNVLRPLEVKANLSQGKGFVRLSASYKQKFLYNEREKGIYLRLFGGWLPHYDAPDANVNLYYNGTSSNGFFSKDYVYDELLFGRNETTGLFSQQTFSKDANIRTLYNGGVSSKWMTSFGIAADVPMPIPLRLYFDNAIFPKNSGDGIQYDYSGGLAIILIKDAFEIYVPFVESSAIRNSLTYEDRPGFFQRVTFLLDINKFNPPKVLDTMFD